MKTRALLFLILSSFSFVGRGPGVARIEFQHVPANDSYRDAMLWRHGRTELHAIGAAFDELCENGGVRCDFVDGWL